AAPQRRTEDCGRLPILRRSDETSRCEARRLPEHSRPRLQGTVRYLLRQPWPEALVRRCRVNTCSTQGCPRGGQLRRGRCRACYEKWRLRQHAYGRFDPLFVDAAPAIAHIEKLRAAGVSWRRMSELTGV